MEKCNYKRLYLVILFIFSTAFSSYGEDVRSGEGKEENAISLDDVIVRGEALHKDLEASSATVITSEDLENRVYVTPLDIVGFAPGVSINQYKQGGTASSFQMRGIHPMLPWFRRGHLYGRNPLE